MANVLWACSGPDRPTIDYCRPPATDSSMGLVGPYPTLPYPYLTLTLTLIIVGVGVGVGPRPYYYKGIIVGVGPPA